MREVWSIRHGESEQNIGLRTSNHEDVPLTEKGEKQAVGASKKIIKTPDIIGHSKFFRAYQTAQPTMAKFPNTPVIILNTHEFTYLEPSKWNGTTSVERKEAVQEYWNRADPHYRDGPNAETFAELCQRGKDVEKYFLENEFSFAPLFSHALFIKMQLMLSSGIDLVSPQGMRRFKAECSKNPIDNTEIFKATIGDGRLIFQ